MRQWRIGQLGQQACETICQHDAEVSETKPASDGTVQDQRRQTSLGTA